jgi:coenzyme PQQ biosynthesis protein PqqD
MESTDRPRLAARVRVRLDRKTGQHMLLYPERGLALNASAHAIVVLCTGEHTVADIVDSLAREHGASDGLARDVHELLSSLAERGLVEVVR